jgi:hypothetical protein
LLLFHDTIFGIFSTPLSGRTPDATAMLHDAAFAA